MGLKSKLKMIPGDSNNPWRFAITSLDFVGAAKQHVAVNNWAEETFGKTLFGKIDKSRWWVENGYWHIKHEEDAILFYLTWC